MVTRIIEVVEGHGLSGHDFRKVNFNFIVTLAANFDARYRRMYFGRCVEEELEFLFEELNKTFLFCFM